MDQYETVVGLADESPTRTPASSPGALIAVAALLATVTNAVAFMLPPLLPVITTSYAHNSVSAATWVFTALTLGGGAGFVLIPRLTDILSDRATSLMSGAFLTGGAWSRPWATTTPHSSSARCCSASVVPRSSFP